MAEPPGHDGRGVKSLKSDAVTSGRATPDTNGTHLKQDYGQSVWAELEGLSLLLCHKPWRTYLSTVDMKSLQALFGGTFDPVHYGHLKPVETLANLIGLTRVTIIPNNVPPHRPQPEANSVQRKHMLELAIADKPLFTLDERELKRNAPLTLRKH